MKHLIFVFLLLYLPAECLAEEIRVGNFSAGEMTGWEPKEFEGKTIYAFQEDGGRMVLKAESNASASGLFKKIKADVKDFPILRWSWKVENILVKGDARTKEGDDYAARIYVVFPRFPAWRTTGINYIWANKLPRGKTRPNSYAKDNVIMLAIQSGPENVGRWVSEERNLLEDYKQVFGKEPPKLGNIAIMTDTDNTSERAVAYYGDIILTSK
jgi:hypothetical protein